MYIVWRHGIEFFGVLNNISFHQLENLGIILVVKLIVLL